MVQQRRGAVVAVLSAGSASTQGRVLALAAIFQAAALVKSIAQDGGVADSAFEASIGSLFYIDANTPAEVFGGNTGVLLGLRTLVKQLESGARRDPAITTYVARLLHLERRMVQRADLMRAIREGLEALRPRAQELGVTHAGVVTAIAELYTRTVSTVPPRIMVAGDPGHLRVPGNAERIRAALLAGLRAAVLWRQLGGSRVALLFGRGGIVAAARALMGQPA